jgi:UTP--glucose-1-phosphate uridylyltransferase
MNCTKAIIPVAGYGTRRLPITKSIEKAMLPVLNRPVIDYVVQDCIAAGIREFYFVVGEQSAQIRSYYQQNADLEAYLRRQGKEKFLPSITPPKDCKFEFIVQPADGAYGTTVPVWLARQVVQPDEQVLIIMGDQFFFNADGSSETAHFLESVQQAGTPSALLGAEVPRQEVSKYGVIVSEMVDGVDLYQHIVEHPDVETTPSTLNNASFYLFDQRFFDFLPETLDPTMTQEYMIIDVINDYVAAGNQMLVVRNKGEYLDCGTLGPWVAANQKLLAYQ